MSVVLDAPALRGWADGAVVDSFLLPRRGACAGAARVMLGGLLAGFPRLQDALAVAGELVGFAVREYCACCSPGPVAVAVRTGAGGVRIEVAFDCSDRHLGERGEEAVLAYTWGLTLIRHLADRRGLDTSGRRGTEHQAWWVEIDGVRP